MSNKYIKKIVKMAGGQRELSKMIGISQSSISDWVTGRKNISDKSLNKLIAIFGEQIKPHELRPDLPHLFPPENKSI